MSWSVLGEAAALGLGSVYIVFLARMLGATGFGTYSFFVSFYSILFMFSDLGVNTYFQREWSRSTDQFSREYPFIVALRLLFSACVLAVAVGYALTIGDGMSWAFFLAFLVALVEQVRDLNNIYFVATHRFAVRSVNRVGDRLVSAVLGLLALVAGYGLAGVFLAHVVARLVSLCIQLVYGPFLIGPKLDANSSILILRRSYPFFLIGLFYIVYSKIDILLLRSLADYQDVGWYSAAYSFINMLNLGLGAVGVGVFPVMARLASESRERLEAVAERMVRWLVTPMIGLAVLGQLFAEPFVRLLYSHEFEPSSGALKILLVAQVFTVAAHTYGSLLYVQNHERKAVGLFAGLMGLNVAANLILIPRVGIQGAAAATLFTEFVNLAVLCCLVRIPFRGSVLGKWAVAGASALMVGLLAPRSQPLLAAAAVTVVYGFMTVATGVVRWQEMQMIFSVRE